MRYAVLIFSQIAVASAALLARWGMALGFAPGPLTAWRLTAASVFLLPAILMMDRRRSKRKEPVRWSDALLLMGAGAALGAHFWSWFASLNHVSVARSTLLVSTTPLWAGLGGWLMTRRAPSRSFWGALAVAGVGVWMVTSTDAANVALDPGANPLIGDVSATFGAVCIAAYFVMTAPFQERIGTLRVIAWTYPSAAVAVWLGVIIHGNLDGVVVSPTLTAVREGADRWIGGEAWLAVLLLALIPQLAGHTALNWSLKHFSAGAVGAATLLEPVFAGLLAWIILREQPAAIQIVGACVLLAGVGWALLSGGRSEHVAQPTDPQ